MSRRNGRNQGRRGGGPPGLQTTFDKDGRVPISLVVPGTPQGPNKIIQGQLDSGVQWLEGLGQQDHADRDHRVLLPTPGQQRAFKKDDLHPWYAYLPPLDVALWERDWYVTYLAPALGVPTVIREERVPDGRTLVITNYRFFAAKAQPGTNDATMGDLELLGSHTFNLAINQGPAYAAGTSAGAPPTVFDTAQGVSILNRNRDDFQPGFALYVPGGSMISARMIRFGAPVVNPTVVGASVSGYLIPQASLQKATSALGAGM